MSARLLVVVAAAVVPCAAQFDPAWSRPPEPPRILGTVVDLRQAPTHAATPEMSARARVLHGAFLDPDVTRTERLARIEALADTADVLLPAGLDDIAVHADAGDAATHRRLGDLVAWASQQSVETSDAVGALRRIVHRGALEALVTSMRIARRGPVDADLAERIDAVLTAPVVVPSVPPVDGDERALAEFTRAFRAMFSGDAPARRDAARLLDDIGPVRAAPAVLAALRLRDMHDPDDVETTARLLGMWSARLGAAPTVEFPTAPGALAARLAEIARLATWVEETLRDPARLAAWRAGVLDPGPPADADDFDPVPGTTHVQLALWEAMLRDAFLDPAHTRSARMTKIAALESFDIVDLMPAILNVGRSVDVSDPGAFRRVGDLYVWCQKRTAGALPFWWFPTVDSVGEDVVLHELGLAESHWRREVRRSLQALRVRIDDLRGNPREVRVPEPGPPELPVGILSAPAVDGDEPVLSDITSAVWNTQFGDADLDAVFAAVDPVSIAPAVLNVVRLLDVHEERSLDKIVRLLDAWSARTAGVPRVTFPLRWREPLAVGELHGRRRVRMAEARRAEIARVANWVEATIVDERALAAWRAAIARARRDAKSGTVPSVVVSLDVPEPPEVVALAPGTTRDDVAHWRSLLHDAFFVHDRARAERRAMIAALDGLDIVDLTPAVLGVARDADLSDARTHRHVTDLLRWHRIRASLRPTYDFGPSVPPIDHASSLERDVIVLRDLALWWHETAQGDDALERLAELRARADSATLRGPSVAPFDDDEAALARHVILLRTAFSGWRRGNQSRSMIRWGKPFGGARAAALRELDAAPIEAVTPAVINACLGADMSQITEVGAVSAMLGWWTSRTRDTPIVSFPGDYLDWSPTTIDARVAELERLAGWCDALGRDPAALDAWLRAVTGDER